MVKKTRNEVCFSVSSALSGYLGALFGVEFILYLSPGGCPLKEKKALEENFTPLQKKIINILQVIEIEFAAARFENVRKYGLVFFKILTEFQHEKKYAPSLRTYPRAILYRLYSCMGDHLVEKGQPQAALTFYQYLLNEHPLDIFLLKKTASTFFMMGSSYLPEAERFYRLALDRNPKDLDLYERLGRILEHFPGRESEAGLLYRDALRYCSTDMEKIRFYLLLLRLNPRDPKLLSRLGRLYLRKRMYIDAKYYLEQAWRISDDAWVALDLSYLYALGNELESAVDVIMKSEFLETYIPGRYLLGLIQEIDEKWEEAARCYGEIPSSSPLFWKAQAGQARICLNRDDPAAAEKLLQDIPEEERRSLRAEFTDLYDFLTKSLQKGFPIARGESAAGSSLFSQAEPEHALIGDISKRSMGAGFWRKYEVLDVCGSGPLGQVLLGRERHSGRKVAIKQLYEIIAEDPIIVRHCQGMLRAVRNISHPQIINIYEDSYYNGCFFYAMEYLEAGSLEQYIRLWAPLTVEDAAGIALQICSALDYLYRQKVGLVHGALKPANILFSGDGKLKIADFDFLWVAAEGGRNLPPGLLKKRGALRDASIYTAPERLYDHGFPGGRTGISRAGAAETAFWGADHRADLYSLGMILFEMVTAVLPFKERSGRAAAAFRRSRKISSPRLYHPALTAEFEQIILRLLQKNPDDRFQAPAEVIAAIKNARI